MTTNLQAQIESLLFVSSKPFSVKKLCEFVDAPEKEVDAALVALAEKWNGKESGVNLVREGKEVQLMSAPAQAELVKNFLKDETTGELTRPSLETLTIIAYRGPITKPEIEQIRGVNCSLILRNLLMRGLINVEEDKTKMQAVYAASLEFIRYLGLTSVSKLPDYERLRGSEVIRDVVAAVMPTE